MPFFSLSLLQFIIVKLLILCVNYDYMTNVEYFAIMLSYVMEEPAVQYLFFDIEGANNNNFVAKMCTFGYVISSTNYQLIQKSDIVINPQSFFESHIIKHKMHAYNLEQYREAPCFNYYYKQIKAILEKEEQLVVGWSVSNDVKYLHDACKRYHLKQIKFTYLDLQKLLMIIDKQTTLSSLENTCEKLGINKVILHKSDEDAYLTMKIAKHITNKLNLSLEELAILYPNCLATVDDYIKALPTQEEIDNKIKKRKIITFIRTKKVKKIFQISSFKEDSVFYFDNDLFYLYFEEIKEIIRYLKNSGFEVTNTYQKANIYIYPENKLIEEPSNEKQNITYQNLKNSLKKKIVTI